jgi:hypothetical protein
MPMDPQGKKAGLPLHLPPPKRHYPSGNGGRCIGVCEYPRITQGGLEAGRAAKFPGARVFPAPEVILACSGEMSMSDALILSFRSIASSAVKGFATDCPEALERQGVRNWTEL